MPIASAVRAAPIIALTMGEPAGIGGEITFKAWQRRGEVPSFFVVDDPERLGKLAARLGLEIPIVAIESPAQAGRHFASALPVLPVTLAQPVEPGRLNYGHQHTVIESIDRAVELVSNREAAAMVTNPIHKAALREVGFVERGHTEYLGRKAGVDAPLMLLSSPLLKVVPVSVHLPLVEALRSLTSEKIVYVAKQTSQALQRDFGIAAPRLAIAGLNPHAGEAGTMGHEENTIIEPALRELHGAGIDARGPLPADSMFHAQARAEYDVAICMYHDQALIPLKALSFDEGVNVTLGLPFVRTSPDHGTGLDIAGTGLARESSLVAALKLAAQIAALRDSEFQQPAA